MLSLTTAHSFELGDVARYLHSDRRSGRCWSRRCSMRRCSPRAGAGWRASSLALPRFRGGKKVPPQILRMQAEDLVAAVFPDQIACAENLAGEREIPDHPLTNQAIDDCLHEAMDIDGLERLLRRLETGEIRVVCCDLTAALAAGAGGAVGAALRLPRRRAAGGAADPGGDGAGAGWTRRAPPISAGSIRQAIAAGARRGLARSGQRRGDCTTRCSGSAS